MKKTIISATIALGLAVSASAATLQYGLDFNTMGSNGLDISTYQGAGAHAITGSGEENYGSVTPPLNDGGYTHGVQGGTFYITDTSGIDGLSLADGFSLGIHVQHSTTTWKDAFSVAIDGTYIDFRLNGNNQWVSYQGSNLGLADGTVLLSQAANTWTHIGLTFQMTEDNTTSMSIYADGTLVNTYTLNTTADSVVTAIQGCAPGRQGTGILVDNLAVYDGVLTAEDMAYLTANAAPSSFAASGNIPEPTTATLSLLALAGLAARRRRK